MKNIYILIALMIFSSSSLSSSKCSRSSSPNFSRSNSHTTEIPDPIEQIEDIGGHTPTPETRGRAMPLEDRAATPGHRTTPEGRVERSYDHARIAQLNARDRLTQAQRNLRDAQEGNYSEAERTNAERQVLNAQQILNDAGQAYRAALDYARENESDGVGWSASDDDGENGFDPRQN